MCGFGGMLDGKWRKEGWHGGRLVNRKAFHLSRKVKQKSPGAQAWAEELGFLFCLKQDFSEQKVAAGACTIGTVQI